MMGQKDMSSHRSHSYQQGAFLVWLQYPIWASQQPSSARIFLFINRNKQKRTCHVQEMAWGSECRTSTVDFSALRTRPHVPYPKHPTWHLTTAQGMDLSDQIQQRPWCNLEPSWFGILFAAYPKSWEEDWKQTNLYDQAHYKCKKSLVLFEMAFLFTNDNNCLETGSHFRRCVGCLGGYLCWPFVTPKDHVWGLEKAR